MRGKEDYQGGHHKEGHMEQGPVMLLLVLFMIMMMMVFLIG